MPVRINADAASVRGTGTLPLGMGSDRSVDVACACCRTVGTWPHPRHTVIRPCSACGTGLTIPPPDRDPTSAEIFDDIYRGSRVESRAQWVFEANQRLAWVKSWTQSGRLLEIGCATGEFVAAAASEGFDAIGIDSSDWAIAAAEKIAPGRVMTASTLDGISDPQDAIALFHVIEHVPDVGGLLKQCFTRLEPDGHLFIEVPRWGSVGSRVLGTWWPLSAPRDHFSHFTFRSLEYALADAGFKCVEHVELPFAVYSPTLTLKRRMRGLLLGHELQRVVAQRLS